MLQVILSPQKNKIFKITFLFSFHHLIQFQWKLFQREFWGFPGGASGEEPATNAGDVGSLGQEIA